MELLKIEKLSISFGGISALTEIDVEVKTGEILGVIGPNGSGKTTFFNCISGVTSRTAEVSCSRVKTCSAVHRIEWPAGVSPELFKIFVYSCI